MERVDRESVTIAVDPENFTAYYPWGSTREDVRSDTILKHQVSFCDLKTGEIAASQSVYEMVPDYAKVALDCRFQTLDVIRHESNFIHLWRRNFSIVVTIVPVDTHIPGEQTTYVMVENVSRIGFRNSGGRLRIHPSGRIVATLIPLDGATDFYSKECPFKPDGEASQSQEVEEASDGGIEEGNTVDVEETSE